jgi:hypothetical protein
VVNLIREIVLERLLVVEGRARKIDQRPDVVARVADKEREVRARFYYRTKLRPAAAMTDSEARAYYDSHPAEFQQGERRRFAALSTAEVEVARDIQKQLEAGGTLSDVKARLMGRDPTLTGTGERGTDPLTYGESPVLDPILFALPLHGVSGPIPDEGRWTVAKVLEILPARVIPFDEAAQTMRQKSAAARTDALLKANVDEARPRYPVKVDEGALRRVRLKAPAGW